MNDTGSHDGAPVRGASASGAVIRKADQPSEPMGEQLAAMFFNHVESQVTLATYKATLLVAANSLLLGSYFLILKDFGLHEDTPYVYRVMFWGVATVAVLLIIGSLASSLWGMLPNLTPKPQRPVAERGVWLVDYLYHRYWLDGSGTPLDVKDANPFFFGEVARCQRDLYVERYAPESDLMRMLIRQIHAKSVWLLRILQYLRLAVLCAVWSVALFTVVLVASAGSHVANRKGSQPHDRKAEPVEKAPAEKRGRESSE